MTQAEALRLVAMLAAAFRTEVSDETGMLWARQLIPYELDDGFEAVDILSKGTAFMPQGPKPLLDLIRDIRMNRERNAVFELGMGGMTFYDWFHSDPSATPELRAVAEMAFPKVIGKWLKGDETAGPV